MGGVTVSSPDGFRCFFLFIYHHVLGATKYTLGFVANLRFQPDEAIEAVCWPGTTILQLCRPRPWCLLLSE